MAELLYVRTKINNCPAIAFVRSGCTTSFLSESFARKAKLLGKVDCTNRDKLFVAFNAKALAEGKNVEGWVDDLSVKMGDTSISQRAAVVSDDFFLDDGAQVLGWIDNVRVHIEEINLSFSHRFAVMPDKSLSMYCLKKFDMLIATDLLGGVGFILSLPDGLGIRVDICKAKVSKTPREPSISFSQKKLDAFVGDAVAGRDSGDKPQMVLGIDAMRKGEFKLNYADGVTVHDGGKIEGNVKWAKFLTGEEVQREMADTV